jgi:cytochrome c
MVHPWGNPRAGSDTALPLLAGSVVPHEVRLTLQTKCADCHSENTRWPAYSRLAPGSWLMEHDVHEARAAMNLSRWDQLAPNQQSRLLASIAAEVANRRMPLRAYLFLHPSAQLTEAERQSVIAWTHAERRRLRSQRATQSTKETP